MPRHLIQDDTREGRIHRYWCRGAGSFCIGGRSELWLLVVSILAVKSTVSLAERKQEGRHLEHWRDNKRCKTLTWESGRTKLLQRYSSSTAGRHCVCTKVCNREFKSVSRLTCLSPAISFPSDANEYILPGGRDTWFLLTTKQCLSQSLH